MHKALSLAGIWFMSAVLVGCGGASDSSGFLSRQPQRRAVVATDSYRVMSFNLRTATIIDAQNHWNLRRGLVVKSIKKFSPDLLGTQECQASQASYLREQLPGYQFVGAGRNNGKLGGEMCALFFRSDRFIKLDEGHFWLSKTPEKPGSKSWGSAFKRMVTWVRLAPRDGSRPAFYFFNTHMDNSSEMARVQGAWLLRRKIDQIADGRPVIVTGDFNTDSDTTPYQLLVRGPQDWRGYLVDSYRQTNPVPGPNEGTRHKFYGKTSGDRIDWIISTDNFTTVSAAIDRTKYNGQYPSDHFPVTAVLRLKSGSQFAGHRSADAGGS
jgi:endonuclease/exonuclease/phosphatase family metal-dependent hydrolase